MKSFVPILIVFMTVSLVSCDLGSDANYQPTITFLKKVKLNSDSTLEMGVTIDGYIKLDSLHVNDTVTILVIGNGYRNSLTNLNYTITDSTNIEVLIPDSIKNFFDESSDFISGKLVFNDQIGGIQLPFEFVAKKPAEKVKIHFQIWSDAVEVSNTSAIQLEFPIKPKIQIKE